MQSNTSFFGARSRLWYIQVLFFALVILYFGKTLFIPMCYGLLIAIVLYPVCKWLENHRWPRSLAIAAGLLIVIILFGSLLTLLVLQFNIFRQDWPGMAQKLKPAIGQLQQWLTASFNISPELQQSWFQQTTSSLGNNAGSIVQKTIAATTGTFFTLFLVPVYAALFLYNRGTFVRFLQQLTGNRNEKGLHAILHEVAHTYSNFIKGMLLVYLVVGILNSIGLLAFAILFGMLTAVMTIIPYVGIIISALLPISVAWVTKDSIWYPVGVVAIFAFVQYLEANIIFPKIVAVQLNVSTWATLVAIIAGGILWGVSGMILFIPFVAILKIVSEHMDSWKPLNTLLSRDKGT